MFYKRIYVIFKLKLMITMEMENGFNFENILSKIHIYIYSFLFFFLHYTGICLENIYFIFIFIVGYNKYLKIILHLILLEAAMLTLDDSASFIFNKLSDDLEIN